MPTFIDESGDCGWTDPSSKPYFTLAAVWFETPDLAFGCEEEISRVRTQKLKVAPTFEFKFARISNAQRVVFLEAVAVCSFYFFTSTLQKRQKDRWLEGRQWRKKAYLYERVIEPLAIGLGNYLHTAEAARKIPLNERVIFDDNKDPIYRRVLREKFQKLKAASGRSLVKQIRPANSKNNNLLQLADMVCGSIVHSLNESDEFKKIISHREAGFFSPTIKTTGDPVKDRPLFDEA